MNPKPPLHILFTMDCNPIAKQARSWSGPEGPTNWNESARSIEGFCSYVLNWGYLPTLFLSVECAEQQSPLLEELAERGAELGLHIHPPYLDGGRYKRYLGDYSSEEQRAIIEGATERVEAAVGMRPRSFRSGYFSASNATFQVLYELGFRQGSLSNPGRQMHRHAAQWEAAEPDAHYVDPEDRLRTGTLPFLELPVTTDPTQHYRGGLAYELCIESGQFEDWHRPIIERHLQRMEAQDVDFRTLCIFTHNHFAYYRDDDWRSTTLEQLLDYLDTLHEHYEVVPTTLAGAHRHFRNLLAV